jgi:hypothetical protein
MLTSRARWIIATVSSLAACVVIAVLIFSESLERSAESQIDSQGLPVYPESHQEGGQAARDSSGSHPQSGDESGATAPHAAASLRDPFQRQTGLPAVPNRLASIPSSAVIQAELASNPHETPRAIIQFATSMAPQMELALHNEKYAGLFFATLEVCAGSGSETPAAIQVICLNNAERLVEKYPQTLGSRGAGLRQVGTARAQTIYKLMNPSSRGT